jgi:hypothetical protein
MSKCHIKLILICILSVYNNSVLSADEFGYLFSSTKQRELLNNLRTHQLTQQAKVSAAPTFQGYVKRNDGFYTLWLNQVPVQKTGEQVIVNAQSK